MNAYINVVEERCAGSLLCDQTCRFAALFELHRAPMMSQRLSLRFLNEVMISD